MFPYRIDMATAEELAGDPFSGDGVFLAMPEARAEEMLVRLEMVFGRVLPAVASAQQGIWVDSGHSGISRDDLLGGWERAS